MEWPSSGTGLREYAGRAALCHASRATEQLCGAYIICPTGQADRSEYRKPAVERDHQSGGKTGAWRNVGVSRTALQRLAQVYEPPRSRRVRNRHVERTAGTGETNRRFRVRPERISVTGDEPLAPDRLLWELAAAVDGLLLQNKPGRLRKCAAPDCGTLFLDVSKTGRRRWCSMANCGNRNKVQRFRARTS